MSRNAPFVVALVSGSHVVNHAYLLLFAPAFPLLGAEFDVSVTALGLAVGLVSAVTETSNSAPRSGKAGANNSRYAWLTT